VNSEQKQWYSNDGKDQNVDEDEALLTGIEVIDVAKNHGKEFKPDKQNVVQKTYVQVHEKDD
jgi:hypothetical protein